LLIDCKLFIVYWDFCFFLKCKLVNVDIASLKASLAVR